MDDHTVAVDTAQTPTALAFAEVFNVAVPFIDRHLAEGRGAKVAIRDTQGDVTYAVLAANVNRAGNALATLGLNPGDRVLMVVKDCPLFFYLFWGAIRAGFVPVPLNTLLRAPDYRVVIDNARAACIVWSPRIRRRDRRRAGRGVIPAGVCTARRRRGRNLRRAACRRVGCSGPGAGRSRRPGPSGSIRRDRPARPRAPFIVIATWW